MTRLSRQIETRLGIDEAFAFIADFGNAMHWDPGVASSEAVGTGPVGPGSRSRLGVRLGSRVAPMEYRVTTFEPPNVVVLAGSGSNVEAVDEIRFASSGTGTTIDYAADIRLAGALRLAQPFLGRAFRKLADDAVNGMRTALDSRADAADARADALDARSDAAADAPAAGASE